MTTMTGERIPFSRRYEAELPEGGLIYDRVPYTVFTGISNALRSLHNAMGASWETVIERICLETDRLMPSPQKGPILSFDDAHAVLAGLTWNGLCDACEGLHELIREEDGRLDSYHNEDEQFVPSNLGGLFQTRVNQVFARNYFGYEMRDGQVERIGAITHEETIAEAKGILSGPDFAGPNEQFSKAVKFFGARPEPDCSNAVKEAVGAVEGLARILLNDHHILLSDAVQRLRDQKRIHGALSTLIEKLYAYRGDAEGAAHGATGQRPVRLEEAEFVLAVSASAIVYLARLFGRAVQ